MTMRRMFGDGEEMVEVELLLLNAEAEEAVE
jgi:hypothetical protein